MPALGRDVQLTDTVIKLDWINAKLQYGWGEGPVMASVMVTIIIFLPVMYQAVSMC